MVMVAEAKEMDAVEAAAMEAEAMVDIIIPTNEELNNLNKPSTTCNLRECLIKSILRDPVLARLLQPADPLWEAEPTNRDNMVAAEAVADGAEIYQV